jgi:hypothetical protein
VAAAGQAAPGPPEVRWTVRNVTRAEAWRFFEPTPRGGDPDYAFIANRLSAGAEYRHRRFDVGGTVQYVQFAGLPTDAIGPGPLGTGALYYDHARRTDSRQVYLRTLFLRVKDVAPGASLQVGRFGYTSGAESPSGNATIEAVKRQRLDSRLIGEFEWSLYQRTFDGARLDVERPAWHATLSWLRPTQGGFEEQAALPLRRVHVAAVTFSLRPSSAFPRTDWQGFIYRYDDERPVGARPDNTLTSASAVNVGITTIGTSLIGAYPAGTRQVDVFGWFAWQRGDWYGERHEAGAAAAELGHQWTSVCWRPWLRAGWFRSSGDRDAADGRHGTFFQMLPTARRYSLSTTYNLMNLSEVFGQALLRPRSNVNVRMDVHRLRLTRATDLWYAGSGAAASTGTSFGFAGRRSNGSTNLGVMVEGAVDWTVSPHFSVNGYLGRMTGGDVVGRTFADTILTFGYIETVVSF